MGIGGGVPYLGYQSAFGIAQETTFGTFVTSTTWVEFNSESLKMTREEQKLESINASRDFTKRVLTNDSVEGSLELDFIPDSDGIIYIMKQAMGGTVSTVAISGAASFTHTLYPGDMEGNKSTSGAADVKSLSMMVRRGSAEVYAYNGLRVNTLSLKAEVGGPVMMSVELLGKSMSLTTSIGAVAFSAKLPCMFHGVSITSGVSIGAATTAECVTAFEFTLNNNLDGDQRCLGDRTRAVIPPVKREVMLKLTQRFDTITTYNRALQNTITAYQIVINSNQTLASSSMTSKCTIKLPSCYLTIHQPEIGEPGVISEELEYSCMYNASIGASVIMEVVNGTSTY
jgi:hypothetical protein